MVAALSCFIPPFCSQVLKNFRVLLFEPLTIISSNGVQDENKGRVAVSAATTVSALQIFSSLIVYCY